MINLVPPKIKIERQAQKIGGVISYVFVIITILVLLTTASIFVADNFLKNEGQGLTNKISEANAQMKKYSDLESQITMANKKIGNLDKADSEKILWSNIVTELANVTPEKVLMKTISLNSETKKVSITGDAATRTDIAKLKDNMEESKKFKNVTFTSSTLDEKSGSYTFNMSCELEETR